MLVPGRPSCPQHHRDHVTVLADAETGMGLLIHGQGCYFMCHSAVLVLTAFWFHFTGLSMRVTETDFTGFPCILAMVWWVWQNVTAIGYYLFTCTVSTVWGICNACKVSRVADDGKSLCWQILFSFGVSNGRQAVIWRTLNNKCQSW